MVAFMEVSVMNRSRKVIFPTRIIWKQGNVENSEVLLREREMQITVNATDPFVMSNANGEKASILLDYGVEIHGGLRLLVWRDSTGKGAKIRVRFGESVSEAMSEIGAEGNATNDHARRDMITEVGNYSMNQIGETGFRFVRIDLEEPNATVVLKCICAVMVYKDVPYRGSFSCSDSLLKRIWDVGAYTVHLNMQDYIWDGIKRDRLVWVGDMHPEMLTIRSVFGEDPSVEKSLDFLFNMHNSLCKLKRKKRDLKIQESLPLDELMMEESKVEKKLKEIDPMNMTPMEALNLLYELKKDRRKQKCQREFSH